MSILSPEVIFIFLGFVPSFIYVIRHEHHRKDELKRNPFGGWYFIFELALSFMVGLIPASLLSLIFYNDYWVGEGDIPFLITLVSFVVLALFLGDWFRFSGYKLPFGKGSFMPFIRENLGKNPYPETDEDRTEKVRLSPLFMGCGLSFMSALSIIIGLLLIWAKS
ncbi:MAG: hypothetical protein Q4D85_08925 [Corynebacterium sp.]|uniref:hypothetical protein n=1 Tax=Corynebacterium sp. TaxID=1720 RepID=UPI0026DC0DEB|nr:hypothetical protein [Corynebacterium sp.]MDO5098870.1 hypothetical protein [Corynebacterium sp.]